MKETTFNIKTWYQHRKRAQKIGEYLNTFRDAYGHILMSKKELEFNLNEISIILNQCSDYMNKTHMPMPKALWRFKIDDPKTRVSSTEFAYGHLIQGKK